MKRFVALLLLMLTLVSCSADKAENPKVGQETSDTKESTKAPETEETKETDVTTQNSENTAPETAEPMEEKYDPVVTAEENGVVNIGAERQLFVDTFLIDEKNSNVTVTPEAPIKQEAVFSFDRSYERGDCVYQNIVRMPDGSYRMYYKAYSDLRRICYIMSNDGINWVRPALSTSMKDGKKTNITTTDEVSPDNLFVFYDTNPDCHDGRRLKGVYGQWGQFLSIQYSYNGKGEHFPFGGNFSQRVMGRPSETEGCYYDTLNTMYWDEYRQQYVAFVRGFHNEKGTYNLSPTFVTTYPHKLIRDIRVTTSDDGVSWSTPQPLNYNTEDSRQMYANAITPYYRSPGLYVGLPTEYFEDGGKRTRVFFMTSRDLLNWNRSEEPYITNGSSDSFSYNNGEGYPCVGFIETAPHEISFYMKERAGVPVLYRYTLRTDGFTSAVGSHITTKPLSYRGEELLLNFSGEIKVTATGSDGSSAVSQWIKGDEIDLSVEFDKALPKGTATLLFEMKEGTKLYSFKFN